MSEPTIEELRTWSAKFLDFTEYVHYYHHDNGKINVDYWKPDECIDQAWRLVVKVNSLGYWMRLHTPFSASEEHYYSAGFTEHGVTGWNGRPDYLKTGKTAPEAILRAVYYLDKCLKESNPEVTP